LKYFYLLCLTACLRDPIQVDVRCEPSKVLEKTLLTCLEVAEHYRKELHQAQSDVLYYKDKNYDLEHGVCTRSYE
jgi:hypothetical protein